MVYFASARQETAVTRTFDPHFEQPMDKVLSIYDPPPVATPRGADRTVDAAGTIKLIPGVAYPRLHEQVQSVDNAHGTTQMNQRSRAVTR